MIEQLFGSKTRVKLLKLFYGNVNRSFYVREITRKIDEQINSVRRELANLQSVGIITSDTSNNKVYYEVNQRYEFFEPLEQIFGAPVPKKPKRTKAVAPEVAAEQPVASDDMKALGHVELACLLGQFTRDNTSGVDVLVVGNINANALQKYVAELEQQENKELRYAVLSTDEFKYRLQIKDRFISNVMSAKKQVLVDVLGIFS
jgi:predicted MarR family transcription regulator